MNIHIDNNETSSITKLKELLENIDLDNDEVVERSFIKLMENAVDNFDIAAEEITPEIKSLNNFLISNINSMKEDINDFIRSNTGKNITNNSIKKTISYINNIAIWSEDTLERNKYGKISNDRMYRIVQFYKSFIENFVNIFPNIILNKVNYNDVNIPNYFGFSKNKYVEFYFS
jgi:hypothetical protein